jgi:glycosyltransferase involved in cell wall biosynthesis
VRALGRIREATEALGVPVTWRLTGRLELDLGVERDEAPLAQSLADASAVLTTPSTLAVEAMLAGRAVGLVDPHGAPAWVRTGVMWRADSALRPGGTMSETDSASIERELDRLAPVEQLTGAGGLWRLVERLVDRPDDVVRAQDQILASVARDPGASAAEVAALIDRTARSGRAASRRAVPIAASSAERIDPAPSGRRRVVNLYLTDGAPLGGVPLWCDRMARAFRDDPDLGFDVRTLIVSASRWWREDAPVPALEPGGVSPSVCLIDPYAGPAAALRTVDESLAALDPDIVVPHYADLCHAAAAGAAGRGVRVVAAMNTFDDAARALIRAYPGWDAAVGVSDACGAWLDGVAGAKPVATIPYGVPVSAHPRTPSDRGPLRLAYVGRMVELQKRISDLHRLIAGLERLGVDAELHLVGDGPDLDRFLTTERRREPRGVRVVAHGPRSAAWVGAFWPTVDVAVLVSDSEGMSISMLEAMGRGVVPVVTRAGSGAEQVITDGVNGVLVAVGDMEAMAERLSDLAGDRARRASMGAEAWRTAGEVGELRTAAAGWARVFRDVLSSRADRAPSDASCRLIEAWRWKDASSEDPAGDAAFVRARLRDAGYRSIGENSPGPTDDAVVVSDRPTPELMDKVHAWRARGLGVVLTPGVIEPEWVRLGAGIRRAHAGGARRIAVFGCGDHTRRAAHALAWAKDAGITLAGLIDDARAGETLWGLPVVTADRAPGDLRPDAVVLSSDAWEGRLWERARPLRDAGVRVVPLYGSYAEAVSATRVA